MMSEEREQLLRDRDANWVIKDFNLKGREKVISAVCDDRRVYLQHKIYIILA